MSHFVLLLSCPDKPGIVHKLTTTLLDVGANIIDADQYSTHMSDGLFFIRIEFVTQAFVLSETIHNLLNEVGNSLDATYELFDIESKLKCSLFVSKEDHCLQEILYQWKSNALNIDIHSIISNHDVYSELANWYKIPFHYVPYDSKERAEQSILSLTKGTDLLVMARFMQILSKEFLTAYANPVVNIHHSFLPSFKGARPYQQAFERGVKLIGATAHFATSDLDEGPIIVQKVATVNHRDSVNDLKQMGRQIEKDCLFECIQKIANHRVMVYNQKTVVF